VPAGGCDVSGHVNDGIVVRDDTEDFVGNVAYNVLLARDNVEYVNGVNWLAGLYNRPNYLNKCRHIYLILQFKMLPNTDAHREDHTKEVNYLGK
jgi:hypothetical protein